MTADELLEAAFEDRADDAVEILTKEPSLIRVGDAVGDTALHVAARAGHKGTVLKMIQFLHKTNFEMLNNVLHEGNAQGDTPLHLALKNGHKELATHLVLSSSNTESSLFIKNDDQVSAFELAQQAGYEELLRLMENSMSPRYHIAPSDIEMRLVRVVLSDTDDEEDEEEEEEDDWIRLHKAAGKGKEDVIVELLEEDEDLINYKDQIGCTALHVAAFNGQIGSLKKIVEVIKSSSELKTLMLEGDHYKKNIPLHYALEGGHEKTACYLVKVAPRATYKVNSYGVSPLRLAVEKGYPDLVRYMTVNQSQSIRDRLLQHAKTILLAHIALKSRNPAVLQALVEGLPELINVPDKKGWKLLSFAAYKGYLNEICYILEHFPDSATEKDEDGSLPIHKAVAGGHASVVKEFLLSCPQSLHEVDKKGRNIIELASLYNSKDVLSYLKEVHQLRGN